MDEKKKANGFITWVDEEIVGFTCECGENMTVSIYKDSDNKCEKCGRKYELEQSNTIYELKI